ncbi:unnamed protein product, partial [marine sediment metagenome]
EMEPQELAGYGYFKETMWKNVHGLEQTWVPCRQFVDYALFNWLYAKKMMDLHSEIEFDLFYVHAGSRGWDIALRFSRKTQATR